MSETPYLETEALLLALEDADADSGNIDKTIDYLAEHFLPTELVRLCRAAGMLAQACREAGWAVERKARDDAGR